MSKNALQEAAFWGAILALSIAGPMLLKIAGAHVRNKAFQTFTANA